MTEVREIDKEISKFLDAAVPAWCLMDFNTFSDTVMWATYDPLIANSWTERILKMIDNCKDAGLKPGKIAELFPTTSQIRCMLGFDLWMAKYAAVSREDRERIFTFYSDCLQNRCLEDPYCQSKNIIHSEKEIGEFLGKIKSADSSVAKILGRAASACYHLSHALYSDMNPSITYDNYGPYDVGDKYNQKSVLAIKDFKNLKCPEIWLETAKLPCNHIQIFSVYNNVKMIMDAASHVIFKGDLIKGLKYYNLKVDGHNCSVEKLNKVSEAIEKMAAVIFQKFQVLDLEKKKEKYYFTKAYFYKDLYNQLEQDWRPSEEVLSEARGRELYKPNIASDKDGQNKKVRDILDPRVDPGKINL